MFALLIIGGIVIIGGTLDFCIIGKPHKHRGPDVGDQIPTLFIPGYWGNRYSFGHMLLRLPIDKQVVAVVGRTGHVHLHGRLHLGPHVGVQVLFKNKRILPQGQEDGIRAVLAALRQQDRFDTVNLVAHSMGGVTALLYTLSQPVVPVAKLVSIAAPYNDLEVAKNAPILNWRLTPSGPAQIAPIYAQFRDTIDLLPANLRWLNIAGDLFIGNRHDGVVGVNSSFAIRYLVQGRVASYQEVLIRGPQATHSLLHENRVVDHDIMAFLWPA